MTALVTGASGGIGFELAEILAREGKDLVLVARSHDKLVKIAADLHKKFKVAVEVIACDLSAAGSCAGVYEQVKQKKLHVDILVNNAGFGDWGYFVHSDPSKQEAMIQLNIAALTQLTRLFLPEMVKRRKGRIMNVASTAAFQPGPLMAVYFATKAYVLSFSCALAYEVKDKGVTVTCLCPGPTASGFQAAANTADLRLNEGVGMASSKDVAEYGYRAMIAGQRVAVYGILNKISTLSVRFIPQAFLLKIVAFIQSKEKAGK